MNNSNTLNISPDVLSGKTTIQGMSTFQPAQIGLSQTPAGNIKLPEKQEKQIAETNINSSINPNVNNTTSIINPSTGMYESGSTITPKPQDQQFSIPTTETTSSNLGGGVSYSDLLLKRTQLENQALQATGQSLQTQYQGLAGVNNAMYSSSLEDVGLGRAGIAQRQATLQNLAASIPAQLATQQLGYSQQALANTLAAQPELSNVQVTATGDVIGTQRNPTTGAVTPMNMGNVYTGTYGQGAIGQTVGVGQISLPQTQTGNFQTSDGGEISAEYASKVAKLPSTFQNLVLSGPEGVAYIDESKLPDWAKASMPILAANAGVPYLNHDDALGLQSISNLYGTLDQIDGLMNTTLKSGVVGKGVNTLEAIANKYTGYKPILTNYQLLRDTAGKAVTALMGGIGSGFRMNLPEIDIAVSNLPTATDSIEQARVKIAGVKALLDNGIRQKFPGFVGTGSLQTTGSQTMQQTKTSSGNIGWGDL